jgi:hypothetical protein
LGWIGPSAIQCTIGMSIAKKEHVRRLASHWLIEQVFQNWFVTPIPNYVRLMCF